MANLAMFIWLSLVFVVGGLMPSAALSETNSVEMIVSLKSAKTVIVRAMPNPESNAIAFVENGKAILRKGHEETNGFVMVQLADGRTGWTKGAFLAASPRATLREQPVRPGTVLAPQGAIAEPAAQVQMTTPVMMQSKVNPGPSNTANAESMPDNMDNLPIRELVSGYPDQSRANFPPPSKRQGWWAGLVSMEWWVVGLIGMLIGLLIGGKVGMVYATRSIHERYIVID